MSRAIGDNDTAGNTPAVGGPLQPHTSKLHPRHLKAALARVLTSNGIDLTDLATKRGARAARRKPR